MDTTIKPKEKEADAILGLMLLMSGRDSGLRENKLYKNKTKIQVKFLLAVYEITKYPSSDTRIDMSILIKIPPRKIQIWFQNRRQAEKDEFYTKRKREESLNVSDFFCNGNESKNRSVVISTKDILHIYLNCQV